MLMLRLFCCNLNSFVAEERVKASNTLPGASKKFSGDKKAFLEQLRQALFASKIISYAQGFMLLREAAKVCFNNNRLFIINCLL